MSLCVFAWYRMLSSFSWTVIIRINILSRHVHQWPVSKTPPNKSQKDLTLGLLLNSDHSDVVLDTGPPADSAEVSDRYCFLSFSFINIAKAQHAKSEKPLGLSIVKFLWIISSHSVQHYKPTRVTNKIMLFFFSQAISFRSFWGEKSELRRFKDGSILEVVLWPCNGIAEKRTICERIIKHLLQRWWSHFELIFWKSYDWCA